MATLYQSDQTIPDFSGMVRQGILWRLDDPNELLALQALSLSETETPIPLSLRDSNLDFTYWQNIYAEIPTNEKDWRELRDEETYDFPFALALVHKLWTDVEHPENLQAIVAIADGENELELELNQTILVLKSGSVKPLLLTAQSVAWKVGQWFVGLCLMPLAEVTVWTGMKWLMNLGLKLYLFLTAGASISGWAEHLADAIRQKREEENQRNFKQYGVMKYEDLLRLDKMKKDQLQSKDCVIIFLHGLLSTDLGTFDSLIKLIKKQANFNLLDNVFNLLDNVTLVGWPHDTLKDIDTNAQALQRDINRVLGRGRSCVIFIAHSRGGLLARATAVRLYGESLDNPTSSSSTGAAWTDRLKCCITFGTPHEGAVLADCPEEFLGIVTILLSINATDKSYLPYILGYVQETKPQGVLDLCKPKRDNFLYRLIDAEREQAITSNHPDQERLLHIFTVGGKVQNDGWCRRLMNQVLQNKEHDMVVNATSSMPIDMSGIETHCDHMSYFTGSQKTIHFEIWRILQRCLVECVDLEESLEKEKQQSDLFEENSSIRTYEKKVSIDGVDLKKRQPKKF